MNTLTIDLHTLQIQSVEISDDSLSVDLTDGRTISVPLGWFPRLLYGSPDERNDWRLIGEGEGIHWESLDEDVSLEHIIKGIPSAESQKSLQRWLDSRK